MTIALPKGARIAFKGHLCLKACEEKNCITPNRRANPKSWTMQIPETDPV
jgi:hypothetical protein